MKNFETIVDQLRAAGLAYGMGKLPLEAADAIEGLQATARSFQEKLAKAEVYAADEMVRADKAESQVERLKTLVGIINSVTHQQVCESARVKKLENVLSQLIEHCSEQERRITEEVYHVDFTGESLTLTNARSILTNHNKETENNG